jgi:hypothetical protein
MDQKHCAHVYLAQKPNPALGKITTRMIPIKRWYDNR